MISLPVISIILEFVLLTNYYYIVYWKKSGIAFRIFFNLIFAISILFTD